MKLTQCLSYGLLLASLPVGAATAQSSPQPPQRSARNVVALAVAYGRAVEINGSVPIDGASVWLRWSHRTKGRFAGGEPAWGIEVVPALRVDQEPRTYGAGGHLVYEHRWAAEARLRPVLRMGAGMILTNREVPLGETRHNYSVFAGAGIEIEWLRGQWFILEYRLQHLSNADTGDRNPGINWNTLGFGLGWSF